jgi:hypothetical protein
MCLMQKHLFISATDLRSLSLRCECGATLTIDLQEFRGLRLRCCPVCAEDYDPRASQDIAALARVYANTQIAPADPSPCRYKINFFIPAE